MKKYGHLVLLPDGSMTRKDFKDLLPDDKIVFGGGLDANKDIEDANRWLQDQIDAAGGFDAWRKQGVASQAQPGQPVAVEPLAV